MERETTRCPCTGEGNECHPSGCFQTGVFHGSGVYRLAFVSAFLPPFPMRARTLVMLLTVLLASKLVRRREGQ